MSLYSTVNVCVLLVPVSLPLLGIGRSVVQRILHICSCFIERIKRVGENDKMRGLSSILSRVRNEFNKFNNKGARMLDSIYRMTLNVL